MKLRLFLLFAVCGSALTAEDRFVPADKVTAEVKAFIEPGTQPLALESADLDGDGRQDLVLVLERQKAKPDDPEIEEKQRPLLVLVRQPDGTLKLSKRNEKIVLCSTCGGIFGDPFESVQAGTKTFSVHHYGGSNWRWSNSYQFSYSNRDATWQLVRVEESSFHTSDPMTEEKKVSVPPKDFGKIDISDFDPDNWKGQGPR